MVFCGTLGLADLALAASAGGEVLLEAVTRCRNRLGQEPPLTCLPQAPWDTES